MIYVPLELLDFCEEQGLSMDGHLIDNPLPLSLAEARQFNPKWGITVADEKMHSLWHGFQYFTGRFILLLSPMSYRG